MNRARKSARFRACSTFILLLGICAWQVHFLVSKDKLLPIPKSEGVGLVLPQFTEAVPGERKYAGSDPQHSIATNRLDHASGGAVLEAVHGPYRNTSRFPRTSLRPYNTLHPITGEKYLLYSPSGGFNNQLMCLVQALYIARLSNRTLIVPPKGKHADLYKGYYRLKQLQTIPMDQVLDFKYVEAATSVKLVPLNITLKDFQDKYLESAEQNTSFLELLLIQKNLVSAPTEYQNQMVNGVVESVSPVVWVRGHFYSPWLTGTAAQNGVHRYYLRFSQYLRRLSANIVMELFPRGNFNAFHIRLGDYEKRAKRKGGTNASGFVEKGKQFGMEQDIPLYVATDGDPNGQYLKPIAEYWHDVTYRDDLARHPRIGLWIADLEARLPDISIRDDLFGLVEQLICVWARKFMGTSVSSFSKLIRQFRKNLNASLPDLLKQLESPLLMTGRRDKTIQWS